MQSARFINISNIAIILLLCAVSTSAFSLSSVFEKEGEVTNTKGNLHYCFYPGSSNPVDLDQHLQNHERSLRYEYLSRRWSSSAYVSTGGYANGSPITLTWSIIPDGVSISGDSGEPTSNSNLRAFLTGIYGSQTNYLAMFNQSFKSWDTITGVNFVYEPNDDGATMFNAAGVRGVRGDIRIGGHAIDGNYNVLAYTYSPNSGDMVIDTSDAFYSSNSNWAWQVVAHELGHALGLAHTCPLSQTKLMEPYFSTNFIGPQHDDILGAQAYYGDAYESNNAITSSSSMGTLATSSSLSLQTVSLHSSGDVDFYSFVAGFSGTATVTAYPKGQTYSVGAPGTGGVANSCSGTFPTVNTNTIYDLILSAYSSVTTLVSVSNSGGLGAAESLTFSVNAGQTYYVKIYTTSVAASASNSVQMYNLSISGAANPGSPLPSKSAAASPSSPASISRTPQASFSRAPSQTPHASFSSAASLTSHVSFSRTASQTPHVSFSAVPSASSRPSSSAAPSTSSRASFSAVPSASSHASLSPIQVLPSASKSRTVVQNTRTPSISRSRSRSKVPWWWGRDEHANTPSTEEAQEVEEPKPELQVDHFNPDDSNKDSSDSIEEQKPVMQIDFHSPGGDAPSQPTV